MKRQKKVMILSQSLEKQKNHKKSEIQLQYQIPEKEKPLNGCTIQKKQHKQHKQQIKELNYKLEKISLQPKKQYEKMKLYRDYRKSIVSHLQRKMKIQEVDFPEFTFEVFQHLINVWKCKSTHCLIHENPNLTFHSFQTLNYGNWLNDEIVSEYAKMLNKQIKEDKKRIRVLNSLFYPVFSKSKEKISAALEKQSITKSTHIIIIIHQFNHWFFVDLRKNRLNIYDSIRKSEESYQQFQVINNILKFAEWFYGQEFYINVDESYPQQENTYDCGVFTICGIKDKIRKKRSWSFSCIDMVYKRFQIAKQIYFETLQGFT